MMTTDVVVTGMGIVCAIGEDKDSFWHALSKAQCGIGTVDLFDVSDYRVRLNVVSARWTFLMFQTTAVVSVDR
jgi:3-oxoacyl-(acyl-carrier-protein) synthase